MARKFRSKKFLTLNEKKFKRKISRRTKRHVLKVKNGGGCCGGNCGKLKKKILVQDHLNHQEEE